LPPHPGFLWLDCRDAPGRRLLIGPEEADVHPPIPTELSRKGYESLESQSQFHARGVFPLNESNQF